MSRVLQFQITNDIEEIETLHDRVAEFTRQHKFSQKTMFQISLALEEIITNIVNYAFEDDREHIITIRISQGKREICVEIIDDGKGFNPLDVPEPDLNAPIEEREIGGLGIHLVKSVMSEVKYRRAGDQNHLYLKKEILFTRMKG